MDKVSVKARRRSEHRRRAAPLPRTCTGRARPCRSSATRSPVDSDRRAHQQLAAWLRGVRAMLRLRVGPRHLLAGRAITRVTASPSCASSPGGPIRGQRDQLGPRIAASEMGFEEGAASSPTTRSGGASAAWSWPASTRRMSSATSRRCRRWPQRLADAGSGGTSRARPSTCRPTDALHGRHDRRPGLRRRGQYAGVRRRRDPAAPGPDLPGAVQAHLRALPTWRFVHAPADDGSSAAWPRSMRHRGFIAQARAAAAGQPVAARPRATCSKP